MFYNNIKKKFEMLIDKQQDKNVTHNGVYPDIKKEVTDLP
jgi:hypothetical protein